MQVEQIWFAVYSVPFPPPAFTPTQIVAQMKASSAIGLTPQSFVLRCAELRADLLTANPPYSDRNPFSTFTRRARRVGRQGSESCGRE